MLLGTGIGPQARPSRIPTPESPSRPLPSIGYVAESISLHPPASLHPRPHSARTHPLSSVHSPPPASHTKPTKAITIEIKAITENRKPFGKEVSRVECGDSPAQVTAVTQEHSTKRNKGRKRVIVVRKATTGGKRQRGANVGHKKSNSWGNAGRLNELRIRLVH